MSVRPSCLVTHEAGGNRSQQAGQITGQAAEGMPLSDKGIVIAISPCIRTHCNKDAGVFYPSMRGHIYA